MSISIPRGTKDLLPGTVENWQYVEKKLIKIAGTYNVAEVRTPIFEHTELFQRGVGESTDIVQKEMYSFTDLGKRTLTLRPEGTASIARAYVSNKLYTAAESPQKFYYLGPMFRYERPQFGRYRQFHQFGVEFIGGESPSIDAELIGLAFSCYEAFNFKHLKVALNTLGDAESRNAHRAALIAHFEPEINTLCEHCQSRLHQNPLRVLDCKKDADNPLLHSAPQIYDYLNEASRNYFEGVKSFLEAMEIPYTIDPKLVRGLDYYTHTVFEIISVADGFGSQSTLCGGGRYNGLVEEIGGPPTAAIGFAIGMERLLLALEAEKIELPTAQTMDLFLLTLGDGANQTANVLLHKWRKAGLRCERDLLNRKMKAQWKAAERANAQFVVIIGDDEIANGVANVKNQQTGEQKAIPLTDIVAYIKGE